MGTVRVMFGKMQMFRGPYSGLLLFSQGARRHAVGLAEEGGEISGVGDAHTAGNLGNTDIAFQQQPVCLGHADSCQTVTEGFLVDGFEDLADVAGGEADFVVKIVSGECRDDPVVF